MGVGIGVGSVGVYGSSGVGTGVAATSNTGTGISGTSRSGTGITALSTSGAALRGSSTSGRGAVLTSPVAQLRLVPASAATHPSSGLAGDLFVDSGNRLWFCQGGASWKQISLV
jgi:hypothetical protein